MKEPYYAPLLPLCASLLVPVGVLAALWGSAAQAAIPASAYNGDFKNASKCIRIRDNKKPVEVYLSNGFSTGYSLTGAKDWQDAVCKNGKLRIQRYEALTIGGRTTYYNRGAQGKTKQDDKVIRPGHVAASDLNRKDVRKLLKRVSPGKLGRSCAGATKTLYRNQPQGSPGLVGSPGVGTIPIDLYYKNPAVSGGSPSWGHYGNPAQTQGSYKPAGLSWNYLLWSWPTYDSANTNSPKGAGQGRASIQADEYIRRCDDVASITSPAYDRGGARVGEVRGAYGKVRLENGTEVYGWFAHSWRYLSWGDNWSALVKRP